MNSKMMILSGALLLSAACKGQETASSVTLDQIPGHESLAQDTTHKESPRLVPAEAYIRTYLTLFGGLTALQTQTQLTAGGSGLFDTWTAYLGALGLPNYATDMSRNTQTNALMVASFERLGIALCDKALEKDLKSTPAVAVDKRLIYNFDVPATAVDAAGFAERFGILHRKFLPGSVERVRFSTRLKDSPAVLVDSADAVARLPDASAAHHEFNEDVVDVNRGLAAAYRRISEDNDGSPRPAAMDKPSHGAVGWSQRPVRRANPYRF